MIVTKFRKSFFLKYTLSEKWSCSYEQDRFSFYFRFIGFDKYVIVSTLK